MSLLSSTPRRMAACTALGCLVLSSALVLLGAENPAATTTPGSAKAPTAKPKAERPFTPGGKWRAGDMNRPRPKVVDPGTLTPPAEPSRPPADAVVLFDGKDLSAWQVAARGRTNQPPAAPRWKVENGYMEIAPKSGSLATREKFGDCQIHIEWATPTQVTGNSQGRGNSGILLSGHGEVQVLDSWQNDTYPDGQAAALYSRYPPLVNVSRKPGEWQSYDIVFEAPRVQAGSQPARPARITVFHNGVLAHHAVETGGTAPEIQITLQDHNNPTRYRNIWLRKLKGYDEP